VLNGKFAAGGLAYRAARQLESFVLRRADAVTTISTGLRDDIIARGVSAENVTVVPNAVTTDDLTRELTLDAAAARARFGVSGSCVVGYVGSLFAWEGLPLLVEALARLRQSVPDIMLLIVGTGPDEAAIRRSVERFGLGGQVVFAGELTHREALNAYAAIDLLVYPRLRSRITELVTPLKPLEAMALGRVCIASDVGGHRELIEDGATGLLFKAGDAEALNAVILRAIGDPRLRAEIAVRGPAMVRHGRTWAQSVANYAAAYARAKQRFAARH
jgi:glycogen synthase